MSTFKKYAVIISGLFLLSLIISGAALAWVGADQCESLNECRDQAANEKRAADLKLCKIEEAMLLDKLVKANKGETNPSKEEVLDLKKRLSVKHCFTEPVQQ